MNKTLSSTLLIAALAAGLAACSKTETPNAATTTAPAASATTSTAQMPPGHPPVDQSMQAAAGKINGKTFTGKIAETKDSAGFTYVRLTTSEGDVWAALPQTSLETGSELTIIESMTTENFESKSLGRKFDRLVFGKLPGDEKAMPSGHGGSMDMGNPHGSSASKDAAALGTINVPRAEGGKTVAEIWGEKASLKDKPVVVAGKVVKYLPGIMGKNWLHLRDGSGAEDKGTNDVTVTTNDLAKVGDTVLVKGTVRVGKDFGAGYAYEVIIEDAKLSPK